MDRFSTPMQRIDPLVVLTGAVLVGTAPLAVSHLRSLWRQEQYQYFPFVIGAVIWFLVSRWRQSPAVAESPHYPALPWGILASAVLLLGGAVATNSGWLAMVSLNVALMSVFWWLGNRRRICYLWGIWCLLWLLVPLPLNVDDRVVGWLQGFSSRLSSRFLDAMGVLHVMSGNVMTLPDRELFVDEACSGIVSVMSVVACSMIYAIYRNRPAGHLLLLTIAGVCWAVLMNVMRITTIAAAHQFLGVDWSGGTPHEVLGLSVFVVVFLALVGSDYLLAALLAPIDLRKVGGQEHGRRLVQFWNWLSSGTAGAATVGRQAAPPIRPRSEMRMRSTVFVSAAFGMLGVAQLGWMPSSDTAEARASIHRALAIDGTFLPARIGPWQLEDFEGMEREAYSDFGRYSRSFRYRHTGPSALQATLSLDFPYIGGWHDLCMCYRGRGWKTEQRTVLSGEEAHGEWPLVMADLENPTDGRAAVAFSGFDVRGEAAEPPTAAVLFRPWFRLRRRLLQQVAPQLLQVQVFAVGEATANPSMQEDLRMLLLQARERFREGVVEGRR